MVGVSAMYTLGIKDRVCETRQMESEFNDARRQAVQTFLTRAPEVCGWFL